MSIFPKTEQSSGSTANSSSNHGSSNHDLSTAGSFESTTPAMYAEYAGAVQRTLNRMPWDLVHAVVQTIVHTWQNGGQLFVMGNGGSASTATHLACDLGKNTAQPGLPRIRALALNDNMALMSAYANDVGYDAVFAEQLRAMAQPGDLVLAISTSGNSPNVLRALEMARKLNLRTIGLGGYSGGKMSEIVDLAVIAPNHCVEQIEDIHMMLAHVITVGVRSAMQSALVRGDEFENGVLVYDGMIAAQTTIPAGYNRVNGASNGHVGNANGNHTNGNHTNGNYTNGNHTNGNRANNALPVYLPAQSGTGYWQNNAPAVNGHD